MIRRLSRSEKGATLTEFGLIAMPLCVALLGSFDLAYQMYTRQVLQGVLNDLARRAAVEAPQLGGTGTVDQRMDTLLEEHVDTIARNAEYEITKSNFREFSGIGRPEKLTTDNDGDGKYDAKDDDCFEDLNGNGKFDSNAGRAGRGGADDIVTYAVTLRMPRLLPMNKLIGLPDEYEIGASTVIRNQPFANQAAVATVCGK